MNPDNSKVLTEIEESHERVALLGACAVHLEHGRHGCFFADLLKWAVMVEMMASRAVAAEIREREVGEDG